MFSVVVCRRNDVNKACRGNLHRTIITCQNELYIENFNSVFVELPFLVLDVYQRLVRRLYHPLFRYIYHRPVVALPRPLFETVAKNPLAG